MARLEVTTERRQELAVIELRGYLSAAAAAPLEAAFEQAADAAKILVVFQEQDFINSAGLAVLFDLVLAAKERGREARIVHPSRHFLKVFRIMGLSQDIGIFSTREQALEGWSE